MQFLSDIVNKKASQNIRWVIGITAIISAILIAGILIKNNTEKCENSLSLYASQLDKSMGEKVAFISTIAEGISSGAVDSTQYYAYVDKMVEKYDDVSAVYVCIPTDDAIWKDGITTYMSGGWVPPDDFVVSDREWYKGAIEKGLFISNPYVDEQSGNICITLSHKVKTPKGEGTVGLDMYMSDIVTLAESSYVGGSYISLVAADGTILTNPSEKYALTADKSTNVSDTPYKKAYEKAGRISLLFEGGVKTVGSMKSELTGWSVIYANSATGIILLIIGFLAVMSIVSLVSVKIASVKLAGAIKPVFKPLEDVSENISNITEGNLSYSFDVDEHSKEISTMTKSLNDTIHVFKHYIDEINKVVDNIADKDLTCDIGDNYVGDYNKIRESLNGILYNLNESFSEINTQALTVKNYAEELSRTSESVALSATAQSQSILAANEEMDNLKSSINEIVTLVKGVENNLGDTNEKLTRSGDEMRELVIAFDEIVKCTEGISSFVEEITEIASQTNLLALNASIEAARAGDAGRGFAVVAEEIQNLSYNSSKSSQKIEQAIIQSRIAVEKGKGLVTKTQETISESIDYSISNAEHVHKIFDSVNDQKGYVDSIAKDFTSISTVVESNAASAEENSAISIQLGECAKQLSDKVNEFKLK